MNDISQPNRSLWLRLWKPFFSLSIYGKFIFVLASFLAGYVVIGAYTLYFVEKLKTELGKLSATSNQEIISEFINFADIYLENAFLLVAGIMILLSITSFLCIRILVELLHEMTDRLEKLRLRRQNTPDGQPFRPIPVITNDEIGQVALAANGLISDIHNISQFRRTIEADETTEEVYKRLANIFENQLDLDNYVIYEIDDTGETIEPVFTCPKELESDICQMSTANLCRAKRTGELVTSAGYPEICPVFPHSDIMTHCCVPMMVGGKILGVIQFLFLYVNTAERQKKVERSLLQARQYLREALPVIQSKRLADNLHNMAIRDSLTGLHNRRFLEGNINSLIAGIRRRNSQIAILMCDMDFFKQVNDEYGHEVGDIVLQSLAKILKNSIRESDQIIRYGGEEFLVLLIDCLPETAGEVAEKIRHMVEQYSFSHMGTILKKTVSIGISEFPKDTNGFWEAIKYADVALYKAKETGRNRVIRFHPTMWVTDHY
jgi:diguanylate cyclase (GGDEF)-like protein